MLSRGVTLPNIKHRRRSPIPGLLLIPLIASIGSCSSSKQTKITSKEIISPLKVNASEDTAPAATASPLKEEQISLSAKDSAAINAVQVKYASYLQVKPEVLTNVALYEFIDDWYGTPYLWGGDSKKGIDCSAFIQRLMLSIYDINIPRTSVEQFLADWIERYGSPDYLSEGDLVFFKTIDGTAVSHVGMYLTNGRFINSSSSSGVSIGNLKDAYWKSKYVAAGRIKQSKLQNK